MVAGATFPPVVVFFDGSMRWLADGFHRVKAAERAKIAALKATVHHGTKRDAILFAIGANHTHGLRRTNADKRRAILTLLHDRQWGRWSDREISRRCGVAHTSVADTRSSLEYYSSDKPLTLEREYTTKHGTVATMETGSIGKHLAAPDRQPSRLAVHYSSETAEHYTPRGFLDLVHSVFDDDPDLDPCSNSLTAPNVRARQHFTAAEDGLNRAWHGRVFMNPPYGRDIVGWIEKLRREFEQGNVLEAIALLPARTDTEWFNTLTAKTDDAVICFLHGRLVFIGNTDPAPFPSMAVYFGPHHDRFARVFVDAGSLMQRPASPLEWFVNHV